MMTTRFLPPPSCWAKTMARLAVGLVAAVGFMHEASAVITGGSFGTPRQITLRVGSANGTVNTVTFDVLNANVSPTPTAVLGTPGNGAPGTSPAGGVDIVVTTRYPNPGGGGRQVTLTVSSPTALTCVGGSGCGATVIPFSTISWISNNKETGGNAGYDIQDGTFTGSTNQSLITTASWINATFNLSNTLIFSYSNTTLYPAGQYTGRVTYTAAIP